MSDGNTNLPMFYPLWGGGGGVSVQQRKNCSDVTFQEVVGRKQT